MKASDRRILLGVVLLGLVAAFWFMILSPKREEVAALDDEIATLESEVAEQEQLASTAEQARRGYGEAYRRLVVLGKAVPTDADAPSLITQVSKLAAEAGVDFRAIALGEGAGAAPAAPAPAPEAPAEGEEPAEEGEDAEAAPVAAVPTEAAVSTLPIGATVGPAGLPVMPYDLSFRGSFFEIADFMASLDGLVHTRTSLANGTSVRGRLLTVNGFTLEGDSADGFPMLSAAMSITAYVAPADQGATGGATAGGPVPTSSTDTVASSSTPTSTTTEVAP